MCLYSAEYEFKIPFHDLDPMNVVWHGNYIKYLEQARCDLFDKIGYTYYDMREDDYVYPIAKLSTKFIKPLAFNQMVVIRTVLEEIEPAIKIRYKMYDKATDEKVFDGETTQIAIRYSDKQSVYNAPEKLKKLLGVKDEE